MSNIALKRWDALIVQEAERTPQRTFCVIPRTADVGDGFQSVSFEQVTRAVNHLSYWLLDQFGNQGDPPSHLTLAYMGIPDLRYSIIVYATIQCRWTIFLPSPRNTTAVNVSLMQQTSCQGLVYTGQLSPVAKALQRQSQILHAVSLPSLDYLLNVPECEFDYLLDYNQICQEPVVIFHSSGSTGTPRPITYTHGALATFDTHDFPVVEGRVNQDVLGSLRYEEPGKRIFDIFPPYHLAGFTTKVMVPLFNLIVPIFGPPMRSPSGALVTAIIRELKPRCVILPPALVETIYYEPDGQAVLNQIEAVFYAGGPLADNIGNQISNHTRLRQLYGSTEIGQLRQLLLEPEDWAYLEFHPHERFEFRKDTDELSELIVFSGLEVASTSAVSHTLPHVTEYHTKDLFEPHPNRPGLWRYKARKDDILVFSSGEKLNPLPLEMVMITIPGVQGAIVTGRGRAQSALLIELIPGATFSNPIEELWPYIEIGNSHLPAHGRVARNMVLLADENKPVVRAAKGTVIRQATEKLYDKEIQFLFDSSIARP